MISFIFCSVKCSPIIFLIPLSSFPHKIMDSSKITALLLLSMLLIASANPVDPDCGSCSPKPKTPKGPITLPPVVKPPVTLPPVTLPPVVKPPITLPPIVKPPVTLPPVTLPPVLNPPVTLPPVTLPPVLNPPVTLPPVTLPPVAKPPVTLPPVTLPPVVNPPITLPPITLPPVTMPPVTTKPPKAKPCPPPPVKPKKPKQAKCPVDTLKMGACADVLGGVMHIGFGDPVVNECCPILSGLVDVEAAVCLCTTLKLKALNLEMFVPIALELLVYCGKTPPPGYTCSL